MNCRCTGQSGPQMFNTIKILTLSAVLATTSFAASAATVYSASTMAGGAGGIGLTNPAGNGSIYALDANAYPILAGPYFNGTTDPASQWVWAAPDSPALSQALQFVFSFTLAAQDLARATLTGVWAVDNEADVYLNGHLIDQLLGDVSSSFNQLHDLADLGWLQAGENVLSFDARNIGGDPTSANPAALLASVKIDVAPVPLPASLPLLGGALAAFGFVASRRKRSV